ESTQCGDRAIVHAGRPKRLVRQRDHEGLANLIVSEWGRIMRKLSVAVIAVLAFAAAGPVVAAEAQVTPGPFGAPPAFPARRVYDRPPVYEPAVVPDVFTAPPAFPAVWLSNWARAFGRLNGGRARGPPRSVS